MDFFGILFDIKNGSKMPYSKNYFDTLFAAKLEELGVKTITGTLPLTFTAKAGNVIDWSISGNDNVGENLFDKNNYVNNTPPTRCIAVVTATGFIIRATNNDPYIGYYVSKGQSGLDMGGMVEVESNTTYHLCAILPKCYISFLDADKNGCTSPMVIPSSNTYTYCQFITPSDCKYVLLRFGDGDMTSGQELEFSNIMLVKGSTAPDHYIPYQKGVGERTEQLMNCSTISGGVLNEYGVVIGADATTNIHADSGSISFTTVSAWRGIVTDFIEIKNDVEKVTLTYSGDRANNWRFCFYDNSQTFISQSPDIDRQTRVVNIPNNTKYFRAAAQFETAGTYSLTSLSITKGSIPPQTYIPFGYQIPIAVSQQGETDKNYNFYIGDSPLTEGETVSKTSTGVDIELFEGENTVSTTLYNKPTMTITYK